MGTKAATAQIFSGQWLMRSMYRDRNPTETPQWSQIMLFCQFAFIRGCPLCRDAAATSTFAIIITLNLLACWIFILFESIKPNFFHVQSVCTVSHLVHKLHMHNFNLLSSCTRPFVVILSDFCSQIYSLLRLSRTCTHTLKLMLSL